jgi:hypothetical protein
MVKSFNSNEKEVIPHMIDNLSLGEYDILVIQVDQTRFDLEEIQELINCYTKIISNPIMITFDGMRLYKINKI